LKLIFVYNAKSGLGNRAFDFAHKIISPSTYQCDLCNLTHGNFGEKEEWKKFRESSGIEMEFYYIEDFEKKFNCHFSCPVILSENNHELTELLNPSDLAAQKDTSHLIKRIEKSYSAST
jgi:hypothetical protein